VLWGTQFWAQSARADRVTEDDVAEGLAELGPMLVAAAAAAAASVDPRTSLPRPSPDFWEVPLDETSLGTAAPVLVGLRAAGPLLEELGEPDVAADVATAERLLTDGIAAQFGRRGYPRLLSTRHMDASVTFLMPPFTDAPPGQAEAWTAARSELRTPRGGLRPGVEFKDPHVSWTPPTALFALTAAASGDEVAAAEYLDWLDEHRTTVGSLPEKVDDEGRPASVAPLTWTACLVLLTLSALEGDLPSRAPER
jgi:GH15 family glucan-1,4-alpha-glucosidase